MLVGIGSETEITRAVVRDRSAAERPDHRSVGHHADATLSAVDAIEAAADAAR